MGLPGERARLFTEDADKAKAIVAQAIQKAIEGGADFAKLVLERIAPAPRGRIVQFDVPPPRT
jgi:hypothetical protein